MAPLKERLANPTLRLSILWIAALLWYWWPAGLGFRSDDYLAISYVQDWNRVWHDFVAPQYDAVRVALFYRPLITLSIAIDASISGNDPFFPFLMNLVVHVINCLLLFSIARRFVSSSAAIAATAFWSFLPSHTEAIWWMVGRVDLHSTLFYLWTILAYCRAREGRGSKALPFVTFVLGCLTKELCLTLPAAIFVLGIAHGGKFGNRPLHTRIRDGVFDLGPWCLVLAGILGLRLLVLGEAIGGYAVAPFAPWNALGFWTPLYGMLDGGLELLLTTIILALLLLHYAWRGMLGRVALAIVLFSLSALPAAGARGDDPKATARYLYLPSAPIACGIALSGPWAPIALLALHARDALGARDELASIQTEVTGLRSRAKELLETSPKSADPIFLPAPASMHGRVLFANFTDRLGRAPFWHEKRDVLPSRYVNRPEVSEAPLLGDRPVFYDGPAKLDEAGLKRIKDDKEGRLRLGIRVQGGTRLRVRVAHSMGWTDSLFELRSEGAASPGNEASVSIRRLLETVPLGMTWPLALLLWPANELSLEASPWLFLQVEDEKGNVLARGERPLRLPLDRYYGLYWNPKRPRSWIPILILLLGIVLTLRRPVRETRLPS